jgi:hypothetical protein
MWDKTTHLFGFIALSYTLRPLYANFPLGYFFFLELRLPLLWLVMTMMLLNVFSLKGTGWGAK